MSINPEIKEVIDNNRSLLEAVYDISMTAAAMIASEEIHVEDSRELADEVLWLAGEFESAWDEESGLDYMEEVEKSAELKLYERYGN